MDTRVKPAYDESEPRRQIHRAAASAAALLFAPPLSGLAATKGLRQNLVRGTADAAFDVSQAR
jgi:hypothetical protein